MTSTGTPRGHYVPASTCDNDQEIEELAVASDKAPWREKLKRTNMIIETLAASFLALLVLLLVIQRTIAGHTRRPPSCFCGSSAVEAIANGCKFDFFGMVWLPDHCRDDNLINTFIKLGKEQHHNWTLFTYPNTTHQLTIEDAASLAGNPYGDHGMIATTRDWHNTHCLYVLLQHFRSSVTHLDIAGRYRSQEHAQHCVEALLQVVASDFWASADTGISEVDVYIE